MPVTRRIRDAIASGASSDDIESIAVEEGMHTLKDACARMVRKGITTISEMKKITYSN